MAPGTTATSSSSAANAWSDLSFVEVLEDLSSRFIVNLPKEELQSIQRICFQVEQAHWFYEDFLRPLNASLPSLNLRRFSIYILQTASLSVPLIRRYVSSDDDAGHATSVQDLQTLGEASYGLEAAFDEFLKYKTRVPVCGVILVSEDWKSCLLVKGWKSSAAWGFPKGKINQSETHRDCAVRETYEETGFDCSHLLPPDSPHWFELNVREQKMRLYVVPQVPHDTVFETQTRKEISKIAWFKMADLPTWKQAGGGGGLASANAGAKFYLVTPFVGKLKSWVKQNKKGAVAAAAAASSAAATISTPTGTPKKKASQAQPAAPAGPLFGDTTATTWPLAQQPSSTPQTNPIPPRDSPSSSSSSDMLLSMLQGTAMDLNAQQASLQQHSQPPPPLVAPQAQKAPSQRTVQRLDANGAEDEKRRQTDALLAQLMSSGSGGGGGAGGDTREQMLLGQLMGGAGAGAASAPVPPPPPPQSREQILMGELMGSGNGASNHGPPSTATPAGPPPPPPPPPQQPFHAQSSAPLPPLSPDQSRAGLLAMLNAGPMRPSAHQQPQQQQQHGYPHPNPHPSMMMPPGFPGPPPPQQQQPPPPPLHWQQHAPFPHYPHSPMSMPMQTPPGYPAGPPPPPPPMHAFSPPPNGYHPQHVSAPQQQQQHYSPAPPAQVPAANTNANTNGNGALLALLNGRG